MHTFQCASCKTPIQAADDLAGKSILCPHCGLATTVANAAITTTDVLPMHASSTGVIMSEVVEAAEHARRRREAREHETMQPSGRISGTWIPSLVHTLVVVTILAILIALLLPAAQRTCVISARMQSMNNLKQLALAIHGFHDTNKRLPFNGSDLPFNDEPYRAEAGASNARSGSWAFQILPFVEQGQLFHGADFRDHPARGLPFNTPIRAGLRITGIPVLLCPARNRPAFEENGGAWSDYFLNNYLNDPKQASKPDGADMHRRLPDITDGNATTILVGQGAINTDQYALKANVTLSTNIFLGGNTGTMRAGDDGAKSPGGVTLRRDSVQPPTIGSWGGPFVDVALIAWVDGSVRSVSYNTQNFSSFLTPTGGENVVLPD